MFNFERYEGIRQELYAKLLSIEGFSEIFVVLYFIIVFRYFMSVSPFYIYSWTFKKNIKDRYLHNGRFAKGQVATEVSYSVVSSFIFALSGVAIIYLWGSEKALFYNDPSKFGYVYLVLSFLLLSLIHEVYFYLTHRWMHLKSVFKYVHHIHHVSKNTSPWASFSFHPFEAIILASFLPLVVVIIPLHPLVFMSYLIFMTLTAISNHLGVELLTNKKILRHFISGTHHSYHHKFYTKNFGLYYCFIDRLFGTDHKEREV